MISFVPSTALRKRSLESDLRLFKESITCRALSSAASKLFSEATKHIPDDLKSRYPEIPWHQIAGIGNVLRHDYDLVDDRVIWDVAKVHFPRLRAVMVELKSQIGDED